MSNSHNLPPWVPHLPATSEDEDEAPVRFAIHDSSIPAVSPTAFIPDIDLMPVIHNNIRAPSSSAPMESQLEHKMCTGAAANNIIGVTTSKPTIWSASYADMPFVASIFSIDKQINTIHRVAHTAMLYNTTQSESQFTCNIECLNTPNLIEYSLGPVTEHELHLKIRVPHIPNMLTLKSLTLKSSSVEQWWYPKPDAEDETIYTVNIDNVSSEMCTLFIHTLFRVSADMIKSDVKACEGIEVDRRIDNICRQAMNRIRRDEDTADTVILCTCRKGVHHVHEV